MAKKAGSSRSRSKAPVTPPKNWELTVLVPTAKTKDDEDVKPGAGTKLHTTELHTAGMVSWFFGAKEEPIQSDEIKDQWYETISEIVATVGEWTSAQSNQWKIDEVTFGLTLGVKGKLLFIAEASAQGSVQVKLKRASKS